MNWRVAQAVEHLLCKCKALNSKSKSHKTKRKEQKKKNSLPKGPQIDV
jgi:hypothetical protein